MTIANPNNQKEMSEEHSKQQLQSALEDLAEAYNKVYASIAHAGIESLQKFRRGFLATTGFRPAPDGYQPEPDIHDIEMVGSELWIKDKEEAK